MDKCAQDITGCWSETVATCALWGVHSLSADGHMEKLRTLHRKFSEVIGSWSWNSSNLSRPTSMNMNELKLNNVANPNNRTFFELLIITHVWQN